MRSRFACGSLNARRPDAVVTTTSLVTTGASAATVIGTLTCDPSGLIVRAPSVMPSGGMTDTPVTPPSPAPLIVNVPELPRTIPVGSIRVGTAPSATPSAEDARKLVVLVGGGVNSTTTPTNGASIGPITVDGGGGGCNSFTTPSSGEVTGVKVVPALVESVSVFASVSVEDVSPAGVTTTTARGPGPAPAAALMLTVTTVPSALTEGGELTVIPSGGTIFTCDAFWKLTPRTVSVVSGAPICRMIGLIESILACGGVTRKSAAAGSLNGITVVLASTWTVRSVCGASDASVTGTVNERPSAAIVGAPTVTPVFGVNCTAVTPCNSNPWTVRVKLSPMGFAAGDMPVATLPTLTPSTLAKGPNVCDVGGT